ncbi:MAG: hypothetical protein AAF404_14300 [Pseudomonadota bacterium]
MLEKIFRWIWQINAVLILIGGLLLTSVAAKEFFRSMSYEEPERITTTIADDPLGKEQWVLGNPREVTGTGTFFIPLVSENQTAEVVEFNMYSNRKYDYFGVQLTNFQKIYYLSTGTLIR